MDTEEYVVLRSLGDDSQEVLGGAMRCRPRNGRGGARASQHRLGRGARHATGAGRVDMAPLMPVVLITPVEFAASAAGTVTEGRLGDWRRWGRSARGSPAEG